MKFNTIIIDDEALARKSLSILCNKHSLINLVSEFESAVSAISFIEENQVDLILLDIEMPEMTGIEFLDALPNLPQVIITSSHTDYAYEAFEFDVDDFLKKPVLIDRFNKAIDKVNTNREAFISKQKSINQASANHELYVKSNGRLNRLPYDDILYFENVGDYIKVITLSSGNHIIHGALKAIDKKLQYPRFLKVHRSYIVNLDKIKNIEDNSIQIAEKVIPVSRAHKQNLINSLNIL